MNSLIKNSGVIIVWLAVSSFALSNTSSSSLRKCEGFLNLYSETPSPENLKKIYEELWERLIHTSDTKNLQQFLLDNPSLELSNSMQWTSSEGVFVEVFQKFYSSLRNLENFKDLNFIQSVHAKIKQNMNFAAKAELLNKTRSPQIHFRHLRIPNASLELSAHEFITDMTLYSKHSVILRTHSFKNRLLHLNTLQVTPLPDGLFYFDAGTRLERFFWNGEGDIYDAQNSWDKPIYQLPELKGKIAWVGYIHSVLSIVTEDGQILENPNRQCTKWKRKKKLGDKNSWISRFKWRQLFSGCYLRISDIVWNARHTHAIVVSNHGVFLADSTLGLLTPPPASFKDLAYRGAYSQPQMDYSPLSFLWEPDSSQSDWNSVFWYIKYSRDSVLKRIDSNYLFYPYREESTGKSFNIQSFNNLQNQNTSKNDVVKTSLYHKSNPRIPLFVFTHSQNTHPGGEVFAGFLDSSHLIICASSDSPDNSLDIDFFEI